MPLRNLAVERGKVEIDHAAPRMQHNVDRSFKRRYITAHRFAHAPLDAIPLNGPAHSTSDGQPHPKSGSIDLHCSATSQKEYRHVARKLAPAQFVDTLKVRVS